MRPVAVGDILKLDLSNYARRQISGGGDARRRRPARATDGSLVQVWKSWPVPFERPCPEAKCRAINLVTSDVLDEVASRP